MPFIFHHNDDDGRCAAAVIYNECCEASDLNVLPDENFIEYSHGMSMPIVPADQLRDNDTVYIVDLALDPVIFKTIERIQNINPTIKIVHIDHHKTTFDFLENMTDEQREVMSHVRKFYRNGLSASMLCWVYGCMTDDERARLDDETIPEGDRDIFDFTENYSHLGFYPGQTDKERILRIPMIVRFIDDWDVWRHALPETRAFNAGFGLITDKHPKQEFWSVYLYTNNDYALNEKIIVPGEIILQYNTVTYKHMMKHAFEYTLPTGDTILCLNADGNSTVFGSNIEAYPACCLFNYEGDKKLWTYSMYSKEDGLDVSEICKSYGGGGHVHAAGFQTMDNIFADHNKMTWKPE